MNKTSDKLSKYADALTIVINEASKFKLSFESISVIESLGRTLAEDICAKSPSPIIDNSSMDGFCLDNQLIANASQESPITLSADSGIDAGYNTNVLKNGFCNYIATGAPLPKGANTIVKLEDVEQSKDGAHVTFFAPSKIGNFIRLKGKEFNAGDILVKKGEIITPHRIGLISTAGEVSIKVSKKPIIAVLTSGDELVFPFEQPKPWQIRNSNSNVLCSLITECGGQPVDLGIARDTGSHAKEMLIRAAELADIIITSGGISMGRKDPFKFAFEELNVTKMVYGVKMKPGKPFFFGYLNNKPLFGLPGNQVSTAVTFELFARPFIKLISGNSKFQRFITKLPLSCDTVNRTNRDFFKRATLSNSDGKMFVNPLSSQASHMLTSIANAQLLFIHPYSTPELSKGDLVNCIFTGIE